MALPTVLPEPLVTGQRMSVDEFIRRWENLPEIKNAELIEGVVYVASPLGAPHGRLDARIHAWLVSYAEGAPGLDTGCNVTFFLTPGSAPQADAYLRIAETAGGASRERGSFVHGAPELFVEVCDSSKAHDLGPKAATYQLAGVREYLTVEVNPFRVTWRSLTLGGSYEPIPLASDGSLRSRVFPGLWLDVNALRDRKPLDTLLRRGMRSKAYKAFRDDLAAKLAKSGD